MNVEKEVAAANRRVQLGIERNVLIAMARIEGITPMEYALKLDAERAEAARAAAVNAAEQLGRNLRAIRDSLVSAAEGIARGFEQGRRP